MDDSDTKEAVQAFMLLGMLTAAIVTTSVAVGLLFGAPWAFVLLAIYSIVAFFRMRSKIRKQNKIDAGQSPVDQTTV